MANKGPCEEGYSSFGIRFIAIAPHSAVECVHESGLSRENPNWQPASQHLSVGREVGSDPEQRLTATLMNSEAGHNLIEYQGRSGLLSDLSHLLQEFYRLQTRMP